MKTISKSLTLSLALLLISGISVVAQQGHYERSSHLEGEWNTYTAVLRPKPNRIVFSDLGEMSLNEDRNMIMLKPFEIVGTDSTLRIIHSDSSFTLNYSYDSETDRITIEGEDGPILIQIHRIAGDRYRRIILQEIEDEVILYLE